MADRIPARLSRETSAEAGPRDAAHRDAAHRDAAHRETAQHDAARRGRSFGLTVGGAFLVAGGVAQWRGRPTPAVVCAALGTVLVLTALTVPARLVPVERAWMRGAAAISRVTTPIFMGVIYFLVLTPVGLVRRAVGRDSLRRGWGRQGTSSHWVTRGPDARRSDLTRQF